MSSVRTDYPTAEVEIKVKALIEIRPDEFPDEDEVFAVAQDIQSDVGMALADLAYCAHSGEISIQITQGDRGVRGVLSEAGDFTPGL